MLKKWTLFFFISVCSFAGTARLTILHLNDTHGHAWAYDIFGNPDIGGFSAISTLVDSLRDEAEAKGSYVLLLHAGDFNTGVPESDLQDAIPDIVAMNMLGFDATAIGNHEFDNPREILNRQISFMNFTPLSANIFDSDGKNPFDPFVIKDFGDLRVAIVGFTTEEVPLLAPLYLEGWRFEDVIQVSRKIIPELKNKANIIVALTHLGWEEEPRAGYTTSKELAEANVGFDLIVDGHSHTVFEKPPKIGKTLVVQAGEWGKYLGKLELTVTDGNISDYKWELIPINLRNFLGNDPNGNPIYLPIGKPIAKDRKVENAMDYFYKIGSEKTGEIIGESSIFLDGDRSSVRFRGTNLTNLITDAMLWKTNSDIAFINGGGIRGSILPGKISYRDVLTVFPFGNTIVVYYLSGEEIMEVLKFSATIAEGHGGYLHVAGISAKIENRKISDVFIGNSAIDKKKIYKVALISYLANGGDGYTMFAKWKSKKYDTGYVDADVLREFISHLGKIENYDDKQRIKRE